MKTNFYKIGFFLLSATLLIAAIGDNLTSVMVNSSGVIQNNPLSTSNSFSIYATPTLIAHAVRLGDITNSSSAFYPISVDKGGTGTNITALIGSWTNSGSSFVIGNINLSNDSFTNLIYTTDAGATTILIGGAIKNSTGSPLRGPGLSISNITTGAQSFITMPNSGSSLRISSTTNIIIGVDNGNIQVNNNMAIAGNISSVISMTSVTNNSQVYQVNSISGITGSVTNFGVGYTNIEVFASGVLTNLIRTGP